MPVADVLSSPLRDHKLAPAGSNLVLAEWTAPGSPPGEPQYQAPLHLHHEDDEAWYVLAGRLRVRVGNDEFDVTAGSAIIGPHGQPHTFWNPDPVPVRYLLVMTAQTSSLIDALHSGLSPAQAREAYATRGCRLLG
jgi:Cupin domain